MSDKLKIINTPFFHSKISQRILAHFNALVLMLLLTSPSFATNEIDYAKANYNKANDFYAEGNYEEAIKEYETIINNDNLSTTIYYNLGNCYYKTDNIPEAILNYERALKLQPDNEDALFNLSMANKLTVDKIDRLPELFIGSTWKTLVTSKTITNWASYTIGLLFLALLFFVSYLLMTQIMFKKIGFYAGLFFLGLSLFTLLMASQHNSISIQATEAIIFSATTTIKSEPNENAEKLFTLHEGTKVTLLDKNKKWSKIKLPNGNVGWIKSSEIKSI